MLPFLVFVWILLAAVTAAPGTRGTEFILGFPPSRNSNESAYINITTAKLTAVTVYVTAPGFPHANLNETINVKQGELRTVTVSNLLRATEDQQFWGKRKAVRITSTAEIIVYVSDGVGYQKFLAYPIDGLGKEYYLVTCYAGCTCHYVITGIYDYTSLELQQFGNNGDYNVSLNNVTSDFDMLSRYSIILKSGTGPFFMRITGRKEIAVFSRTSCTGGISPAVENADSTAISEQVLPAETWGKTFMVPSHQSTRDISFHTGFFSVFESTITVKATEESHMSTVQMFSPGGWIYKRWTTKTATISIETSVPGQLVLFYRYSTTGESFDYNYPFVTVPPMELFSSDYEFNVNVNEPFSSSLVLLAQQEHYTGLRIDGQSLPDEIACQLNIFKDQFYQECQIQIAQGLHRVYHESPNIAFGCIVYGSSADDIYLNFCGTRLTPINKECTVSDNLNDDGLDNDCDGAIDEEICNGIDDDNDGRVDEDCAGICSSDTCKHGGTCLGLDNGTLCSCRVGYSGTFCETAMFLPGQSSVVPDEIYIDGEHTVTLRCQFSIYEAHGFVYKIRWYSNNNLVVESPFLNPSEAATYFITDNDFAEAKQDLFDINIEIYCTVDVSKMRDDVIPGDSLAQSTPEMFNPLKIDLSLVSSVKGKESAIPVTMNIPFGCSETSEACALQLKLFDPKDSFSRGKMSIGFKGTGTCGIEIKKKRVRRGTAFIPLVENIVITSVNDISYDNGRYAELKLETNVIGSAKPYWKKKFVDVLPVNIAERPTRQGQYCYSHVDPHIRTFDGRIYHHHVPDQYEMYINDEWNIKIQMDTVLCNGNTATCACAIAMQYRQTIYAINHCGFGLNNGYQEGSVEEDLPVESLSSNKYRIDFPNELCVIVHTGFSFGASVMNIDIYPAPSDGGNVRGLCGNCDGIPGNDEMPDGSIEKETDELYFPLSCGIEHTNQLSKSLFNVHPSQHMRKENDYPMYCVCPSERTGGSGDAVCKESKRFDFDNKVSGSYVPFIVKPWINPNDVGQQKRRNKREVPSNNTLTYDEARSVCESSFQGCPVYSHRNELSGIDTEPFIDECALDVQTVGEVEWAIAHCEALSDYFVHRLETDEIFSDGLDQTIVAEVLSKICPGNCSGHGLCLNGSCVCDEGYGTDSCVVDLNKPPVLYAIAPDGICDIARGQTCDIVFVTGDGFIVEPQCRVQIQKGYTTGNFGSAETIDTECLFLAFNEIAVNLTEAKLQYDVINSELVTAYRYGFSISNNGMNFSDFEYVTVIDGTCQEVVVDGTRIPHVGLKHDFCYIDGVCYGTGTTSSCSRCEPSISQYTWTNDCNEDSNDRTNLLAIGVGVACAVGLGIILVLIIVAIRIMRKPKRVVSATPTPTRSNANRMLQTGDRNSKPCFMFENKASAREHSNVSITI